MLSCNNDFVIYLRIKKNIDFETTTKGSNAIMN